MSAETPQVPEPARGQELPDLLTMAEVAMERGGENGGEKFSKREFWAENGGKQPVSAEPSGAGGE